MSKPVIYWFRHDLRIDDLPGLNAAVATGQPLIACFVLDDVTPGPLAMGAASRWWLHHSLSALATQLEDRQGRLLLLRGAADEQLLALAQSVDASAVYCSRGYQPWDGPLEKSLHDTFDQRGVAFKRYPGSLLFEPEHIQTQSGGPFKVFTPFWKACLNHTPPAEPVPLANTPTFHTATPDGVSLASLNLTPEKPDWAAHWRDLWQPGAEGANRRLTEFLDSRLDNYADGRDHPGLESTSRLSPHLHHGEISPRQVWHATHAHCERHPPLVKQRKKFLSELGWREFSYHLLHHFPELPHKAFKPPFDDFPWLGRESDLRAWQRGATGYPIVDAGMR
ncbi:MAG: deoxyribodipyrimidine photo-lyase, partial [Halioglobus sp.]|nr:deoxyribodipyrimidine photo-lyase [Halioglobus sp.]